MSDGTNVTEFKLAERTRLETWVFMVKWQSSVTPRFLTESDKGTDAQATVTKSGKEKERSGLWEGRRERWQDVTATTRV